jgi:hypothetical protein
MLLLKLHKLVLHLIHLFFHADQLRVHLVEVFTLRDGPLLTHWLLLDSPFLSFGSGLLGGVLPLDLL